MTIYKNNRSMFMQNNLLDKILCTLFFALIGFSIPLAAEDIELYISHNVEVTEEPRVLILFDTSGSMDFRLSDGKACYDRQYPDSKWDFIECKTTPSEGQDKCWARTFEDTGAADEVLCSTNKSRMSIAKEAVKTVLTENASNIRFGLMRFGKSSGEGGYVVNKIGTDVTTIKDNIDLLDGDGGTPLAESLYEAYLYMSGGEIDQGNNSANTDRDTSIESSSSYTSPFIPLINDETNEPEVRCDNSINIIIVTDGDPSSDEQRDDNIISLYNVTNTTPDSEKPVATEGNYLSTLAKYLYSNSHPDHYLYHDLWSGTANVQDIARTFTIGFGSGLTDKGLSILRTTATAGGGVFFKADTSFALAESLVTAIDKINEVNTTFTAPSVSSSNFDRTETKDAVYYAMFYPDLGARWHGNLKKLKISGNKIVDSTNAVAIDGNGNIESTAKTFWLPADAAADGNDVKKGGANLYLSKDTSRTIYTNVGNGSNGELPLFNLANVQVEGNTNAKLAALMGIQESEVAEVEDIIKWAQGLDVDDVDENPLTTQRTDIMGDALHSKPIALEYGENDTRVILGTNAGFIHMFKDNDNTVSESWAFIPSELFKNLHHLKDNSEDTKVYGIDAPPAVFFDDKDGDGTVDSTDEVLAFFGMRRGGTSYYALDITNPDKPSLKWTIENTGVYSNLGQTWSKPYIGYIDVAGFKGEPLLIFGGGYDTNKDEGAKSGDNKGQYVYIVSARTGNLVWKKKLGGHSIPGDIAVLDSDFDGYIDRLYAADTGGNVWRIDMDGSNTSNWSKFKFAKLGASSAIKDRRFFYQPEVARTYFSKVVQTTVDGNVTTIRKETPYEAVLIGSGNRSHPKSLITSDQLYMLRDENTVTKSYNLSAPTTIKENELANVLDIDGAGNSFSDKLEDEAGFRVLEAKFSTFKGWKYNLALGEKSLSKATVIGGVAYFSTFTPPTENNGLQCSLGGGAGKLYAFHLHYGTAVYDSLTFEIGDNVPDTAQLFFGKDAQDKSQFLLIGVGIGEGQGVIQAKSIEENLVPTDIDGDGKIDLVTDKSFGLRVSRPYIYRLESQSSY